MKEIVFSETQKFKTLWAWLAVLALNILFIYAIVQQMIFGVPFGTKPAPDFVLIIVEFFLLCLLIFLLSIKLKTRITGEGIFYRFYPFQLKERQIAWHELSDAYMRDYNSFQEYGGWGLRTGSPKTGKAINTSASSNRGLQLRFGDGRLLLIGTKRPDEIQIIIDKIIQAGKINRRV